MNENKFKLAVKNILWSIKLLLKVNFNSLVKIQIIVSIIFQYCKRFGRSINYRFHTLEDKAKNRAIDPLTGSYEFLRNSLIY